MKASLTEPAGYATVQDVFLITGRGVIVIAVPVSVGWQVSVGDKVILERPDGSVAESVVRGIEMPNYGRGALRPDFMPTPGIGLMFGRNIQMRAEIPVGTRLRKLV